VSGSEDEKMTRVLVTAEAFGFGPASKLHAVCVELGRRGVECHFVGDSVAATFARSNADAFASIVAIESMADLQYVSPDGFDAAISVMDPYLSLWAGLHDVPCVYVDSLYWFWQWPAEREPELQQTAKSLLSRESVAEAFAALATVPMHDSEYVAHYLASVSCVQRTPKTAPRARRLTGLEPIRPVDAIVDLSHRAPAEPQRWLATTSGLVNSLLPIDSAVEWVRTVARLIEEAAELGGLDQPVTLAGNPAVLELCPEIATEQITPMALSHDEILRAMNDAVGCLTPPGLTTMLECAAYGTPMVMLPEQHYGHLSNFEEVSRCGDPGDFPQALLNPDGARHQERGVLGETLAVADQLKLRFERQDDEWRRMVADLAAGMQRTVRERDALRKAQEHAVRRFVGGFDGAAQVAEVVQALLVDRAATPNRPPVPAERAR
jgi:hypothetical protein